MNIGDPYATKAEIIDLIALTKLNERVIKRWLDNQRQKLRKTSKIPLRCSHFTKEDRIYLSQYFHRTQQKPSKEEIKNNK